jgi:hypothetical protein
VEVLALLQKSMQAVQWKAGLAVPPSLQVLALACVPVRTTACIRCLGAWTEPFCFLFFESASVVSDSVHDADRCCSGDLQRGDSDVHLRRTNATPHLLFWRLTAR